MKILKAILLILAASSAQSVDITISDRLLPSGTMEWTPFGLDSCKRSASGVLTVWGSRSASLNEVSFNNELWTLSIGPSGSTVSCEFNLPDDCLILTKHQLVGSGEIALIACTLEGDTVWTSVLEGSSEWDNAPAVSRIDGGIYLVSSKPDCHDTNTLIQSISATGERIFTTFIDPFYLLDITDHRGETSPSVSSFHTTSNDDIMLCGSVRQFYTSASAWFVCVLDGITGEPIWKKTGYSLGMAEVNDAVETSEGLIVGVGATSIPDESRGFPTWGEKQPFVVILNEDGELMTLRVLELDSIDRLYSIAEIGRTGTEFLIAGKDSSAEEMVLLQMNLTADPD